jgi:hypothetical protein
MKLDPHTLLLFSFCLLRSTEGFLLKNLPILKFGKRVRSSNILYETAEESPEAQVDTQLTQSYAETDEDLGTLFPTSMSYIPPSGSTITLKQNSVSILLSIRLEVRNYSEMSRCLVLGKLKDQVITPK